MCIHVCICIYTYVSVCIHACVYIRILIHIYMYILTWKLCILNLTGAGP